MSTGYDGSYGFSADLKRKQDLKYDRDLEAELQEWIEETLGNSLGDDFHAALKSGIKLCKLVNKLKKKTIRKINKAGMPFKERENINKFLNGCRKLSVAEHSIFNTADLYEKKNMGSVLVTLDALRRGVRGRTEVVDRPKMTSHRDNSVNKFSTVVCDTNLRGDYASQKVSKRDTNATKATKSTNTTKTTTAAKEAWDTPAAAAASTPKIDTTKDKMTSVKTPEVAYTAGPSNDGSYGLSAELKRKIDLKYDTELEDVLTEWIEEVNGAPLPGSFQESLKSGVLLCMLINNLHPKTVTKISRSAMPFKQRENINKFLNGCRKHGIPEHSMFSTCDLFEAKNMGNVLVLLDALRRGVGGRTEAVQRKKMTSHYDSGFVKREGETRLDKITGVLKKS